jgi:hypothetical protein
MIHSGRNSLLASADRRRAAKGGPFMRQLAEPKTFVYIDGFNLYCRAVKILRIGGSM